MKKRILLRINIFLGALCLLLVGCHAQKATTNNEKAESTEPSAQEITEPVVIALYGVPTPPPEQVVCKYGVPNPRQIQSTPQDN